MSYSIELTENFKKEAKKLVKKYPSLKNELAALGKKLAEDPTTGTHLGNDVYKIRLAIKSKSKGKRGGGRVIYLVRFINEKVYLLSIYSKGHKDDISDQEIEDIVKDL